MIPTRAQLADPNYPVSDSDYDAIVAAIMETSRGRWFLSEYARRNRQADTAMLINAIGKMQETLDMYGRASRPYQIRAAVSSAVGTTQRPTGSAIVDKATDTFDFGTLKNCA